ncbi:hypothetical protein G9A89_014013 [Geosiphon pyriformis]|nr:hypothetical protein G9A89_014013 [Geosiphon pyriformis]
MVKVVNRFSISGLNKACCYIRMVKAQEFANGTFQEFKYHLSSSQYKMGLNNFDTQLCLIQEFVIFSSVNFRPNVKAHTVVITKKYVNDLRTQPTDKKISGTTENERIVEKLRDPEGYAKE